MDSAEENVLAYIGVAPVRPDTWLVGTWPE
jgi:hypothetical protein